MRRPFYHPRASDQPAVGGKSTKRSYRVFAIALIPLRITMPRMRMAKGKTPTLREAANYRRPEYHVPVCPGKPRALTGRPTRNIML